MVLMVVQDGLAGMVVTALDELAWLFNLRGRDLPFTPFFKGYCVLTKFHTLLYIHKERQTDEIKVSYTVHNKFF
jgi:Xaa-Pro aminopeptidase